MKAVRVRSDDFPQIVVIRDGDVMHSSDGIDVAVMDELGIAVTRGRSATATARSLPPGRCPSYVESVDA